MQRGEKKNKESSCVKVKAFENNVVRPDNSVVHSPILLRRPTGRRNVT